MVAEKFDLYRKVWRECNHPGPMPHIFLQRMVHVAETDEKAREEAEQYILGRRAVGVGGTVGAVAGDASGSSGRRPGRVGQSRIGFGSNSRGMGTESDLPDNAERGRVFRVMSQSYDFSIENGLAHVGSPER